MKRFFIYWTPLAAYMGLVLVASLRPMPDELPNVWQIDKLYHLGAYFVMGLLWARAFNNGRTGSPLAKALGAAALITFLFGSLVEVFQIFFPYRSGDALDAVVNGGGGIIGALAYGRLKASIARTENHR